MKKFASVMAIAVLVVGISTDVSYANKGKGRERGKESKTGKSAETLRRKARQSAEKARETQEMDFRSLVDVVRIRNGKSEQVLRDVFERFESERQPLSDLLVALKEGNRDLTAESDLKTNEIQANQEIAGSYFEILQKSFDLKELPLELQPGVVYRFLGTLTAEQKVGYKKLMERTSELMQGGKKFNEAFDQASRENGETVEAIRKCLQSFA